MCERPEHPRAQRYPRYLELSRKREVCLGQGIDVCAADFSVGRVARPTDVVHVGLVRPGPPARRAARRPRLPRPRLHRGRQAVARRGAGRHPGPRPSGVPAGRDGRPRGAHHLALLPPHPAAVDQHRPRRGYRGWTRRYPRDGSRTPKTPASRSDSPWSITRRRSADVHGGCGAPSSAWGKTSCPC